MLLAASQGIWWLCRLKLAHGAAETASDFQKCLRHESEWTGVSWIPCELPSSPANKFQPLTTSRCYEPVAQTFAVLWHPQNHTSNSVLSCNQDRCHNLKKKNGGPRSLQDMHKILFPSIVFQIQFWNELLCGRPVGDKNDQFKIRAIVNSRQNPDFCQLPVKFSEPQIRTEKRTETWQSCGEALPSRQPSWSQNSIGICLKRKRDTNLAIWSRI